MSLQLECLGGLRVSLNGSPLNGFVSSKVQALLCYLAVTGRPHLRPALAALLWGDQTDAEAATNLRQAIANLRRLLAPYLIVTRHSVAFNQAPGCRLDVTEFQAYLAAADTDSQQLTAAMGLYAGDFLDGFSVRDAPAFEEWALSTREQLRGQVLSGLHILAAQHTARAEYTPAIAVMQRLLALDPWREDSQRQLMLLLSRSGRRDAALAQYETYRRTLDQELAVEPLPETTALYERIRSARSTPRSALPASATPLIGREREQAELVQRLADPACRLLTLIGPGGVGKTRLALQATLDLQTVFLNGVYFIPLAAVSSANVLVSTIAGALGLVFSRGADPLAQLLNNVREKELLLVLDNFEQLVDRGVDLLAELLRRAPDIKMLVTSRERLQLHDEWLLELHGLRAPSPNTIDRIESYAAVQLFLASARRLDRSFELSAADESAIVRICRLVDGMPLGIELAAAWVRMLPCHEIAREIEASLDFLAVSLHDLPERQRSMRAVFDHSWRLLGARERAVLRQLSVFRAGFVREAAERVAGATVHMLSTLLDKSLLRRGRAGRYELHELVRQYAAEQLTAAGEQLEACDRHCTYYTAMLQANKQQLRGGAQQQAIAEIDAEIENVRAAWRWAGAHSRLDAIDRALESIYHFYNLSGWFQEGVESFNSVARQFEALPNVQSDPIQLQLGRLATRQGALYQRLAQYREADELLRTGLALIQQLSLDVRQEIAFALCVLGDITRLLGDAAAALLLLQESLAIYETLGDHHGQAAAQHNLGYLHYTLGAFEEAHSCCAQSLALFRSLGDQWGVASALRYLGIVARDQGNLAEARQLFEEGRAICESIGDRYVLAYCLNNLGTVAFATNQYAEAELLLRQGIVIGKQIGHQRVVAFSLNDLSEVYSIQQNYTAAREVLQESLALFNASGDRWGVAIALHNLGTTAVKSGAYAAAETYFRAALNTAIAIHALPIALDLLVGFAELLARKAQNEPAVRLLSLALHHPACERQVQIRAEQLCEELKATMPTDAFAAAIADGRFGDFDQIAQELLE
ncbi:MAG: tetratricopeptide repeat protein [Roseiflexaceae bacterium]